MQHACVKPYFCCSALSTSACVLLHRLIAKGSGLPKGVKVLPLYGALPPEQQDAAICADPAGERLAC